MKQFWAQVTQETGTMWTVELELYQGYELEENKTHAWSELAMYMIWLIAPRERDNVRPNEGTCAPWQPWLGLKYGEAPVPRTSISWTHA